MKWRAWLEIRTRRLPAGLLRMEAAMNHKCSNHKCSHEAQYFYHWPGCTRTQYACLACGTELVDLASRMGTCLIITPLPACARVGCHVDCPVTLPVYDKDLESKGETLAVRWELELSDHHDQSGPTPPAIEPEAGKLDPENGQTLQLGPADEVTQAERDVLLEDW